MMTNQQELKEMAFKKLKKEEGYRQHPYKCTAGKLTIGYGRNLDDVGISELDAEYLLQNDIDKAIQELKYKFNWFDEQSNDVKLCLIDMTFNLGLAGLLKFKNMLFAIGIGNLRIARAELLDSSYARQLPSRSKRNADLLFK